MKIISHFQNNLCIDSQVTTVYVRLVSKNREKFHSLVNFAGRHIYRNNREDIGYNRICMEQINITIRSLTLKLILMTAGVFICGIGPIYYNIVLGIKTSITNVKIPLIDEDSNAEFLSNLVMQFIQFVHGIFG